MIGFICIIINLILAQIYSVEDLRFVSLAFMNSFKTDNLFLPILTSITGITFYYCFSGILEPAIGKIKSINFISRNTIDILSYHLIIFNILNIISISICEFRPEAYERFIKSAWSIYGFTESIGAIYVILGIVGALLLGKLLSKGLTRLQKLL